MGSSSPAQGVGGSGGHRCPGGFWWIFVKGSLEKWEQHERQLVDSKFTYNNKLPICLFRSSGAVPR